jgi:hypothetical protein
VIKAFRANDEQPGSYQLASRVSTDKRASSNRPIGIEKPTSRIDCPLPDWLRNHSPTDDWRSAHLRRYSLGATPISRLNTRLKELSDSYPTADAAAENDVWFERIRAPALYMRHWVRYSRGVWPNTVLNFRAKADRDMRASRASDFTDQRLSTWECMASMALLRCLSDIAANHPLGGAAEVLTYARIA